jgi:hypothetical protein
VRGVRIERSENPVVTHVDQPEPYNDLGPARTRLDLALLAKKISRTLQAQTVLNVGPLPEDFADAVATAGLEIVSIDLDLAADVITSQQRWDVVVAVETLELLEPGAADKLIDALTGVTNRVIVSVSASGRHQTRQVASRSVPAWVAAFAERGFYRRVDLDLEPVAVGTVLFERGEPTLRDLAYSYEVALAAALSELAAKRDALRQVEGSEDFPSALDLVDILRRQVDQMRHQLLISRDRELDVEHQLARMRQDRDRAVETITAVKNSTSWRVGRAMVAPAARVRTAANRLR